MDRLHIPNSLLASQTNDGELSEAEDYVPPHPANLADQGLAASHATRNNPHVSFEPDPMRAANESELVSCLSARLLSVHA